MKWPIKLKGVTEQEAQTMLNKYHAAYPEVRMVIPKLRQKAVKVLADDPLLAFPRTRRSLMLRMLRTQPVLPPTWMISETVKAVMSEFNYSRKNAIKVIKEIESRYNVYYGIDYNSLITDFKELQEEEDFDPCSSH